MSYRMSIYVGPYININGDLMTEIKKVKRVCPNNHIIKDNDVFCSKCGSETVNETYTVKQKKYPTQLIYDKLEQEDIFWSPEGLDNVLLHNRTISKDSIQIDAYDNTNVNELDNVDLNEVKRSEIDFIINRYPDVLKVLTDFYGENNVTVSWGIINYWS